MNRRLLTSTPIMFGAATLIAAVAGWLIGSSFLLGSVLVAGGLVGVLVLVWPETALVASLLTIILGQLIRIPVGGSEILPNDVILPALIFAWTLRRLTSRYWTVHAHSLTLPISLFVVVMALSLLINVGRESTREWLTGGLYFVRWLEYLALFWMGQDFFRTRTRAWRYLSGITTVGVVLAGLGFAQLKLFPDFTFMVPRGWDPHIGRLLSTWFDPNYLGGLFVLLSAIAICVALARPWRQSRWWWAAAIAMLLATLLTYSRSAYVGLLAALVLIGVMRYRVALFIGILAMVAVVLYVPRVQERVIGIRSVDTTAQLRLVSYRNALRVIDDHPYFGVGYNLYKYVQVEYNFVEKTEEHSASGSDSSLLTTWVTTGTIGLIIYLWLLAAMLRELWKTWHDRSLPPEWQAFGFGAFAGVVGLITHSQFVNGLHYPHLLEMLWLVVAMAIAVRQPKTP